MAKLITDEFDYTPGSTVYFTASDFTSGSPIQFQILNLGTDGLYGGGDDFVYSPWTVTDGLSGDINNLAGTVGTTWIVPDSALNSTLILTATGDQNGDGIFGNAGDVTAETTFTDAGPTLTIDESAGLQNSVATPASGDVNDNDIDVLINSLPIDFSSRLTALDAGTPLAPP